MELTSTLPVVADTAEAITALVKQFPNGKFVRVVVTDEPSTGGLDNAPQRDLTLTDFLQRLDAGRQLLPPAPWQTSEEAMDALREGERD